MSNLLYNGFGVEFFSGEEKLVGIITTIDPE